MKLGTETGSLVNHIYSRASSPAPKVGDGATILCWSDRRAATVIEVTGLIVKVQHDTATRTDKNGMSDMQDYTFEYDPRGCIETFRRGSDGKYHAVQWSDATKRWNKAGGGSLIIGKRNHFRDFGF